MRIRFAFAFALAACFVAPLPARAETPFAAVDISPAYPDAPMVRKARAAEKVNRELVDFLRSKTPLDARFAALMPFALRLIGTPWADEYAQLAYGTTAAKVSTKSLPADEIAVLAYILAMDQFSAITPRTLAMFDEARRKAPSSLFLALLSHMAHAQRFMASPNTYCGVWRGADAVLRDPKLALDMRLGGLDVALDYLVNFRDSCVAQRSIP